MKVNTAHSERGQVLVLIILSLVGLLGFAALAIDGGMIYSERRVAQNAADAAAYAGAASLSQEIKNYDPGVLNCTDFNQIDYPDTGWNADEKKPTYAQRAAARAIDNTFTIEYRLDPASVTPNDNAVWMECEYVDKDEPDPLWSYVDVHVRITRQVSTSLMHLFYNGPAINTVDSIVRVYPPAGIATGATIVALCSNTNGQQDGIIFGGDTNVKVSHGKIRSNCRLNFNGGSGLYNVPDGIHYYTEALDADSVNLVSPTTISYSEEIPFPFNFSQTLNTSCNTAYGNTIQATIGVNGQNASATFNPGKYAGIQLTSGSIKLNPGLYCIYGDVNITSSSNGITVDGINYTLYGKDVTFYMPDSAGKFSIGGGGGNGGGGNGGGNGGGKGGGGTEEISLGTYYLTAATDTCFQTGICESLGSKQPVKGLLLWYDPSQLDNNPNIVDFLGNSVSVFEGTVTAPYTLVKVKGSGGVGTDVNIGLQIIADDVAISGSSNINIYYDKKKVFTTKTQMGLER